MRKIIPLGPLGFGPDTACKLIIGTYSVFTKTTTWMDSGRVTMRAKKTGDMSAGIAVRRQRGNEATSTGSYWLLVAIT
jgi:hypothetical protein